LTHKGRARIVAIFFVSTELKCWVNIMNKHKKAGSIALLGISLIVGGCADGGCDDPALLRYEFHSEPPIYQFEIKDDFEFEPEVDRLQIIYELTEVDLLPESNVFFANISESMSEQIRCEKSIASVVFWAPSPVLAPADGVSGGGSHM